MTIVGRFVRIFDLRSVILLLLLARESVSILFNQTSYIETNPVDITKQFTLSFRTCRGGTLLRQNGTSGDYFELSVLPGTMNYTTDIFSPSSLALRWQTTGSKAEVHVGSQLDQNKPYHVIFSPRTASQNSSQNATLSVRLGSEVHTEQVPDAIYSVSADTLILGQGFVGCITFGDMFDLNVSRTTGISEQCPLDSGRRCHREACRSGYKGYYCEINIDECGSSPCHHAATCEDGIANYTCSCGPAWFGRNCDNLRNKTFCDYKPCENGGICQPISDFNNYTCTCLPPSTGRNCNQTADPCSSSPCQSNATCSNIRGVDFQCDCLTGFAGRHCETNIDDCARADCGPGKCVDGIARHTCDCSGTGYTGQDCQDDIDECSGTPPCKNNATCSNYAGGYLCTCVGDFRGTNCDEQIDDCLSKPCKNGGNCTDSIKDFACACPPGFSGKSCETVLHSCNVNGCTACDDMPCNHGNCSCNCTDHSMFYNCSCEAGYRGARCDEDINECMSGLSSSKICGDNGTCRNTNGSFKCECSEGFTGKYCNETEGPCNPNPCIHGSCQSVNVTANMNASLVSGNSTNFTETYNCSCFIGWRGRNCSEDIDECQENIDTCNRSRSDCMNTLGRYQCRCFAGYEGGECEDIDECRTIKPCIRGKCENKDGDYACFCPNGFSDKNCSMNLNDCFDDKGNKKCQHGRCEDGIATFTCICDVGWTGGLCDIDVDECFLGYCKNNISCNNTDGSYSCTCLAGYTDVNCTTDIDDCVGSPCLHGGMCMDKVNDYECNCTHGYEGKSCEVDIDWCNVTRNNGYVPCDYGICEDGLHNYTCQCFDGFSGLNCSIDEDECIDMPCKHGAICVQKSNATAVKKYFGLDRIYPKNESAGYLCVCQPGYNGPNCENDIDECSLYRACHGNGTKQCDDGINNYTCICNSGYKGRNCSEDIDECSSSPCQNDATCQNLIAQYKCICDSNHTGVNCESLVDPCTALTPCRNGATCHVVSDYNYTCSCAEGFAGRRCTDRTTLGFDGTSSMAVRVPQTTANISFSFQTIFPNGVLVSESRRWRVSLVSGKLGLTCTDSSPCEIGQPGIFTDSDWHKVDVSLNGSYVTARVDSWNCSRHCGSSRTRRAVAPAGSELVVGADLGDSDRPKFVGSIRDFSVNDVKYYPGVSGVITEGLAPDFQRQNVCSPDPCVNGVCRDLWTRYTCDCDRHWTATNCTDRVQWGTFGAINQLHNGYRPSGNESYASYSLSTTFNHLSFTVRTRSTSSVIIRLSSDSSTFLSVETDHNGLLRLREKNGLMNSQSSEALKINDAVEHFVYINRTVILLDNTTYDVAVTPLPVRNVFVGGLPGNSDGQFRGCIRDVRVNGQQLLFFNQTAAGLNSTQENIAVGCSGEDVCANVSGSIPCSNGANCTDLWNEFQCKCRFPYGGDNCELYGCEWTNPCLDNSTCVNLKATSEYECISQVTFNDSYSSAYFTNSTPLSDLDTLKVQFRTRQNNTVILSSVHNLTYFEISVQDGRVKLTYSLAENMSGIVNTDVLVSDGNWRELSIKSTASQTYFSIRSMDLHQDKFTFLENSSVLINISLLNHSFVNLLSEGGVRIGYSSRNSTSTRYHLLGCLREVRLGKHLLTFSENITVDSSPVFRPAKSAFSSAGLTNVRIGCHGNDLCTGTLCGNGTCVEGWNDFRCMCPVGYSGERCELNSCTSSPCVNGACTVDDTGFNCTCPVGITGDRCQFNPCAPSPCVNGTCTLRDSGFKCTCANDYTGAYCNETCTEDFCKNGGNCTISGGKITCKCRSDWTGRLCESAVPRDDDDDEDEDDLALIIGLAVAGGVLVLLVVAVIFVCTRQTSSTFGTYSPSSEEKSGARVEMSPVLNVPPPEKLI